MAENRIYNFSAGPSMLPLEVLKKAQSQMLNYEESGMSVMEMSHRSKAYDAIITKTQERMRSIMNIPDNYKVLFLQGGATSQFSMVPLNLLQKGTADYIVTGYFANKAYAEAKKYGEIVLAGSSKDADYSYIPAQQELQLNKDADYVYLCANNTITVPNGNMFRKRTVCRLLPICPVTSCPSRWMYPNSASFCRSTEKYGVCRSDSRNRS